ncbi:hypothetical protein FACS1894174_07690 [Bacteroidia bacterium]|nr:hypothetical protein FACS1894155_01930 [Bacteroidia bacterium]GHV22709.1 hypothetical protein FACS1894174_07690 [Bacteroidia bacterium]
MEDFTIHSKYVDPLTDFGFKWLFFNELNKDLLINFLNEIIREEGLVTDIRYLPPEQLGYSEKERRAVFDIFCTNEKGEYFVVEMQRAKQPYFRDRSIFYASLPVRRQAPKGSWNFCLKAVYLVAILDFVLFNEFEEDKEQVIEHIHLVRERTKTVYSRKLNFVFVELPKFRKPVEELSTNTDNWLFSLKNLSTLEGRPPEVQGKIFEKLFKSMEIERLTVEDMEAYKKSVLEYRDVRDSVEYAREEGREEGREQRNIAIARKCLKKNMSIDDIIDLTGLPEEQILKLK